MYTLLHRDVGGNASAAPKHKSLVVAIVCVSVLVFLTCLVGFWYSVRKHCYCGRGRRREKGHILPCSVCTSSEIKYLESYCEDRGSVMEKDPWLRVPAHLDDSLLVMEGLCRVPAEVKPTYQPQDLVLPVLTKFSGVREGNRGRKYSGLGASTQQSMDKSTLVRIDESGVRLPVTRRKPSGSVVVPPQDVYIKGLGQGRSERDPRTCVRPV